MTRRVVIFFQLLLFDSNKAFVLAGVGAPLPPHRYVKEMSRHESRVTKRLENNMRIKEDGPQREHDTQI